METNTTKDQVLASIREKKIGMLPRWRFVAATGGVMILAGAIVAVSFMLITFILFSLRLNGHESLLSFGGRGISLFLMLFPWPLLILDIALIAVLHRLLQRFRFAYRTPTLYLFVLLVLGVATVGAVLDRGTPLNDRLLERADRDELPRPFGELYEGFRVPAPHNHGIYRGIIQSIGTSSITLSHDDHDLDGDEQVYTVRLPNQFDVSTLEPGDRVYVAGDKEEERIDAFGVRLLSR